MHVHSTVPPQIAACVWKKAKKSYTLNERKCNDLLYSKKKNTKRITERKKEKINKGFKIIDSIQCTCRS